MAAESPQAAFAVPGNGEVEVYWHSAPWGTITAYKIYRDTTEGFTPGAGNLIKTETGALRQYTDTGVANDTTYYYKVVADDSVAVEAVAYPFAALAVIPKAAYTSTPMRGIVQWWKLDEVSDGTAQVNRAGAIADSNMALALDDNQGFMPSAEVDGRVVADATAGAVRFTVAAANRPRLQAGYGSWCIVAKVKWPDLSVLGNSAYIWQRDTNGYGLVDIEPAIHLAVTKSTSKLTLTCTEPRSAASVAATSTSTVQANRWYTLAGMFDADGGKIAVVIVDDAGVVNRVEASIVDTSPSARGIQTVLARAGSDFIRGYVKDISYFRRPLSDAQLQWINTHSFSEARFAPRPDPEAAPFSFARKQAADFDTTTFRRQTDTEVEGLYFYRPWPLYQWDASLAATNGRYVWAMSTDHTTGGIWLGYSEDPGVRPTTFTKVIDGSGNGGDGRTLSQIETPWLVYRSGEAQPFTMYAHGIIQSGTPAGVTSGNSIQETHVWTSANLVTWTPVAAAVPVKDTLRSGKDLTHTGYAIVFAPNELPGITSWTAYHLATDVQVISLATPSADPLLFDSFEDAMDIDDSTMFEDGGFDLNWYRAIVPVGQRVFAIGRGDSFDRKGMSVTELFLENSQFRKPSGRWELLDADTDVFPTVGYTQEVMAYIEDGIAHVYRLKGFYDDIADERIDYYTAVFDVEEAAEANPVGVVVTRVVNDVEVSCFQIMPTIEYQVYRKIEGAGDETYVKVGDMPTTLTNGKLRFTETVSAGVDYEYEVRTFQEGGAVTAGAATSSAAGEFVAPPSGLFAFETCSGAVEG